ncbi:hypothetical protein [Paenibacillus agilis]|uniref:Uncharacterized protein n=1 Tax=Paenibacillus agilis TaxID=3020863 RepID=A0A559IEF2_9BACL|nr:hypothetical protein [Paenibacillus agilis]TVX86032.1 hypothetical protein FPZ44_24110 [Paenibacillus agilis]
MAGQLERTMWGFDHYIKDAVLKRQFQELYAKVVEENKNNVVAFIPVTKVDVDKMDISERKIFEDYEIRSGTRKDGDEDEFDTEAEYITHLKEKKEEEFKDWKVVEKTDEAFNTIYVLLDADGDEYSWNYSQGESMQDLEDLKQEWIDEQPEFEDLELECHEIYWNTVWRFNNDLDREVADKVGLGYLEMNESGDEYLFLLGCGMDLTPKIVAYQALAHGYIDESYLHYFKSKTSYTKDVMGKNVWNEVVEKLGIKRFFRE